MTMAHSTRLPSRSSLLSVLLRFDGVCATPPPTVLSLSPIKLSFKTQNSPIILLRPWIYSRISSMETEATVYLPQDTRNIRGTQQILTERINPQCTFPTQMPLAPLGIPITPAMLSGAPDCSFQFPPLAPCKHPTDPIEPTQHHFHNSLPASAHTFYCP